MTNKEAIERIKTHMRVHKIGEPPHLKIAEALYMSIDALEASPTCDRDTPMQARSNTATEPTRDPAGKGIWGVGTTIWFCPKCGMFNTATHKFCWECGQALTYYADEPKE